MKLRIASNFFKEAKKTNLSPAVLRFYTLLLVLTRSPLSFLKLSKVKGSRNASMNCFLQALS